MAGVAEALWLDHPPTLSWWQAVEVESVSILTEALQKLMRAPTHRETMPCMLLLMRRAQAGLMEKEELLEAIRKKLGVPEEADSIRMAGRIS